MARLPRGRCLVCGGWYAVRRNGSLREHRVAHPEHRGVVVVCEGAGLPPESGTRYRPEAVA